MVLFLSAEQTLFGPQSAWPTIGKHDCVLQSEMDHGLHLLSPNAPWFIRFRRFCRKLTFPTYQHRLTKYYYPRRHSIVTGWIQTASTKNPYIIHPLSTIALYQQTIVFVIWSYVYISRPYIFAFGDINRKYSKINIYVSVGCAALLSLHILMNFFTGFCRHYGKGMVELRFSTICKRYACTYFIPDLLVTFPWIFCIYILRILPRACMFVYLLQFARAKTYTNYAVNIGHLVNLKAFPIQVACFFFFTLMFLHWQACIVHVLPHIYEETVEDNPFYHYKIAMNTVSSHFFLGYCNFPQTLLFPMIVTLIAGFLFRVIVIAQLLLCLMSFGKTRVEFETLQRESNQFMTTHDITYNMYQKINLFFNRKYQGRYYRKSSFMNIMSKHICDEIHLHSCGHLICTMKLCNYLQRDTIGEMITTLKPAYYMVGDVVFSVNDPCESLWLISYGKMASYTESGMEVNHFGDGKIVGLMGYYADIQMWTMVVIEPTEAFVWNRADIERLCAKHHDLRTYLNGIFSQMCDQFDEFNRGNGIASRHGKLSFYSQLADKTICYERRRSKKKTVQVQSNTATKRFVQESANKSIFQEVMGIVVGNEKHGRRIAELRRSKNYS